HTVQFLRQLLVKGTSNRRSVRQGKCFGSAVHSNAGRSVRAARGGDSEVFQALCQSAERGGCTGRHLRAAHSLSAEQTDEILVRKLRHKRVHGNFSIQYV